MFCSNCGNQIEDGAVFCSGCGKSIQSNATKVESENSTPVISSASRQKKGIMFAIAALIVVVVAVVFFANSGELNGTWVHERSGDEFVTSIRFSGNRFTAIEYQGSSFAMGLLWQSAHITDPPWNIRRLDDSAVSSERVWTNLDVFVTEGGYAVRGAYRHTVQGTYSITGDTLELVFSDGSIQTFNISRTENTLNIGRDRFIRR